MSRKIILFAFLLCVISITNAQNWLTNFEEAKNISNKENKHIILVFQGSDWCAPCINLDKKIWSSEEFKEYAKNNYVMLRADFPRKKKNALSEIQQKKNNGLNERKNFKQWTWDEINSQTPWSARAGLQVLNHNDTFYLFGGRTPLDPNVTPVPGASIIHGDVWSSNDKGLTWNIILESNPTPPGFPPNPNLTSHWANRSYFQALNKGDEMFIIGGQDFNIITVPNPDFPDNCPEAPFPGAPNPPCEPTMQVPFSRFFNDVWKSSDGINWSRIIDNQIISPEEPNPTHWVGRAGLSAVVFNDYIYVMGGSVNDDTAIVSGAPARQYFNDVWRSSDGSSWEKVNNAPWAPRAGGIAVVKDGYMYMIIFHLGSEHF